MKTISKNIIVVSRWMLAVGAVLLAGCSMDLAPEDKLTEETFFTSAMELQQFSNSFYRLMPTGETMYEEQGEHFVSFTPSREVLGTRIVSANDDNWSWSALRDINFFLAHTNQCKDEEVRHRYEAVGYFFRAYFYFQKLQYFGEVPWYNKVLNSDDKQMLAKPRDSRDLVVDSILSDLDKAYMYLPRTHTPYEVNAWTALALRSRVCTFEGTFRKYHDGDVFNPNHLPWQELLEEGAKASLTLMQEGGYSLYDKGEQPYRQLFASVDANPDEYIWARRFSVDLDIKNNANAWSVARATGFTRRFVNLYLNSDGTRFTDKAGYETMQYLEECENRDPRLSQTVQTPGYIQYGAEKSSPVNLKMTFTGYKYIKFVMEAKYNTWGSSVVCLPIFRYAEVLLNYAECKAEAGTLTQNDLDISVNLLRDRVHMPHIDMAWSNANPDAYMESAETGYPNVDKGANKGVILEIRRERLIETPLEGLHYWDIMRWKEGKTFEKPLYGMYFPGEGKYDLTGDGKPNVQIATEKKSGGIGVTNLVIGEDIVLSEGTKGYMWAHSGLEFNWDEGRDYLYPIPTEDRVLTNGSLTQNPGWRDGLNY